MSWERGYIILCDGPDCGKSFRGSEQECIDFKRINKWYYHKQNRDLTFCSKWCIEKWVADSFSNNYGKVS